MKWRNDKTIISRQNVTRVSESCNTSNSIFYTFLRNISFLSFHFFTNPSIKSVMNSNSNSDSLRYHSNLFLFIILLINSSWHDNQIVFLSHFLTTLFIFYFYLSRQEKESHTQKMNYFFSMITIIYIFYFSKYKANKRNLIYLHITTWFNWDEKKNWTFWF